MATSPLDGLDPEFHQKLDEFLADCAKEGAPFRPFFGVRDPVTQGRLWRRSRSAEQVAGEIARLKAIGAPFLAACIEKAGPANGPWATNAIPGLSWHQWGLAMDCVWLRHGKGSFDTEIDGANNGYAIYARLAPKHGLTCLASIGDHDHVQLPKESSPLHRFTVQQIDHAMAGKFNG